MTKTARKNQKNYYPCGILIALGRLKVKLGAMNKNGEDEKKICKKSETVRFPALWNHIRGSN